MQQLLWSAEQILTQFKGISSKKTDGKKLKEKFVDSLGSENQVIHEIDVSVEKGDENDCFRCELQHD